MKINHTEKNADDKKESNERLWGSLKRRPSERVGSLRRDVCGLKRVCRIYIAKRVSRGRE